MSYDQNIPVDPEDNLRRLEGIGCHLASKLVRQDSLRDQKMSSIRQMQDTIDDLDEDPTTQQEVEDASRREQILLGYKYDLARIDDEVERTKGKLAWNERQQDKVNSIVAMKSELRHKPFKDMDTSQ